MDYNTKWTTNLRYKPYQTWSSDYLDQLKKRIDSSTWRLNYHIQPSTGLLNDPNGFTYFNNEWHIFYQSFPFGPVHGVKSWFHLTSKNLVDWTEVGTALYPDSAYDSHGVYSGSALPINDQLFLAYTGNVRDSNWHRKSYQLGAWMDNENQISKLNKPIVNQPPSGYTQEFRDPQLFTYKNSYYFIIGAQNENEEGKILTYTSTNLIDWDFNGELNFTKKNLGFMIECPNILFIGDKVLLLFCPQGLDKSISPYQTIYPNTYVIADSFDSEKNCLVNPSSLSNLDEGFEVYATQAFNSPDGRALAVSWIGMPEIEYPTDKEGWAHCLSIVKELRIEDGQLKQLPVEELKELRGISKKIDGRLDYKQNIVHAGTNSYELLLDFEPESIGNVSLFADETSRHSFDISFNLQVGTLTISREKSGVSFADDYSSTRNISIPNSSLSLQIFIDRSIIEIFINNGEKTVSSRVFPNMTQTEIFIEGTCGSFSGYLWELRSMMSEKYDGN